MYTHDDLEYNRFNPIMDKFLIGVQKNWFADSHKLVTMKDFVPVADEWFKSTQLNTVDGWNKFDCVDFTLGCTHFIESTAAAYSWKIQVLPDDYSVYTFMGINSTHPGNLEPGVPLMVSVPQWRYLDVRADWNDILNECEQKSIDVHLDCAWLLVSKDFEIDLSHPCIKSVAMSLSKAGAWNRCGLRWSRQRRMDSITMLNHYYPSTNANVASAGYHIINSIPRDYHWNTYGTAHNEICKKLELQTTKVIHVVKDQEKLAGIGSLINSYYDVNL
jgi:hypothetical protein|tara:strand:+ start:1605 stop:2426 length:822 start_codon:yes stop_codon:yes gene_type:complete